MGIFTVGKRTKVTYPFGTKEVISFFDRSILGGKGAGLAEMSSNGIPVPPGFIITTEACNVYRQGGRQILPFLQEGIEEGLRHLGGCMGLFLGDIAKPLLVSVRSGARVSMPGMMDTLLNLGLNDQTVEAFAQQTHNPHLAFDSYRRFIAMYGTIVAGIPARDFEQAFEVLRYGENVQTDVEVSLQGMQKACELFRRIYFERTHEHFPQDVREQLFGAIAAVFNSWDSERAVLYRELNRIPDSWGTAVIVQAMVFGNKNEHSATGVAFTRDPATGKKQFYGEFLLNAQGEEVVAGKRTPHPLNESQKQMVKAVLPSLEKLMPEVYAQLVDVVEKLEAFYKDMQDIEFTVDDGRLFMLQTRTGKRTGFAAVRMAIEMLDEGLIDEKTALQRVNPGQIVQLLAPVFDEKVKEREGEHLVAKGLNAGPGAASGAAVFSAGKAVELHRQGVACILVRDEANPNDFPGVVASEGVLTIRGGSTSHAAVVARGMGKPCVVGCGALHLNEQAKTLSIGDRVLREGEQISIDGTTGEVFFCALPTSLSEVNQVLLAGTKRPEESLVFQQFDRLLKLADSYRTLHIRTNADTARDCRVARAFGAEGVGLCRTEHMFLEANRLNDVRAMLFSTLPEERERALSRLLPYQRQDFIEMFREMEGLPVTIRLLDPPLHEFMPRSQDELFLLAKLMGVSPEKLMHIRASLEERNPMLGHRGCRLGVTYPDLTIMQARAVFEAAIQVEQEGKRVLPEIMVPLVGIPKELSHQKVLIDQTAQQVFVEKGREVAYTVGTMIELPRAALLAAEIAKDASFFSFGTNDLTQTTFGISRDDAGKFVPSYVRGIPDPMGGEEVLHLLSDDPFQVLDEEGVGRLIEWAMQEGRRVRPDLECGVCGEHGGEMRSVAFFHRIGMDYVSCSPYRVPVARLAAAISSVQAIMVRP